jgi:hypothetical protein
MMIALNSSRIIVVASPQLSGMRLEDMEGRRGRVIEDLTSPQRRNKGYMVHFPKSCLGEKDWFIPVESVYYEE